MSNFKYPKIYTLFEREKEGKKRLVTPIINKDYSIQALSYVNKIIVEEKIDGTNAQLEVCYYHYIDGERVDFRYFSRNNQINNDPNTEDIMWIRSTINKVVNLKKIKTWYFKNFVEGKTSDNFPVIKIYGEVYGEKIQGNKYLPKGERNFIVFDIKINNNWLSVKDRNEICNNLGLKVVPKFCELDRFPTFEECYDLLFKTYPKSIIAKENGRDEFLEGFILRPQISLYTHNFNRVIGKIKRKDFE